MSGYEIYLTNTKLHTEQFEGELQTLLVARRRRDVISAMPTGNATVDMTENGDSNRKSELNLHVEIFM
jgi:hypothetical protein